MVTLCVIRLNPLSRKLRSRCFSVAKLDHLPMTQDHERIFRQARFLHGLFQQTRRFVERVIGEFEGAPVNAYRFLRMDIFVNLYRFKRVDVLRTYVYSKSNPSPERFSGD
ncbi:hypothetical protein AX768_25235 [Burkholderia sp. PAMC 28687]|nr:hypothetical protein AX768_25235 [Burkholderia sp. PAMC 28687]